MNGSDAVFVWLARAARIVRGIWLLSGVAAAALVLSAGVAIAAATAAWLNSVPAARAVVVVSALLGAAAFLAAAMLGHSRSSSALETARRVRDDTFRDMLRSVVELDLAVSSNPAAYPFSRVLTQAHADATGVAASTRSPAETMGLARRPNEIVAAFSLSVALLALTLGPPSLRSGLVRALKSAGAPAAAPAAVPGLWFDIAYHPPAYAGGRDRMERRRDGSLKALRGTEARVAVSYVGGIKKAEVVRGDVRLPMTAEPGGGAAATFVMDTPFSYGVEIEGTRERVVSPEYAAEVVPDSPPQADLLGPSDLLAGEKEVAEDGALDLSIEGEDDFGIKSIALVTLVQGSGRERTTNVAEPAGAPARWSGTHHLELSPLGLRPGDRVALSIEARDNDAVSGSKPGRSRNYHLKVYSSVEHRAAFIEKVAEAWEALIAWLAFELEHPSAADSPDARNAAAAKALDLLRGARDAADPAAAASEELKTAVALALSETGRARAELRGVIAAAVRKDSTPGAMAAFSKRLGAEVGAIERHIIVLQDLLDRERLAQIESLSADIDARKKRLSDLIDRYRATKDERLRAGIDSELSALESKLRELQKLVAALQHGISDVNVNRTALKDSDLSRLADLARDARSAFAKDDAAALQARLSELGAKMDALSQGMQRFGADLGDARYAELGAKMAKMAADLSEAAAREKDLLDETLARRDMLKSREESYVSGKAAAARKKLLEAIESLKKDIGRPLQGLEPPETSQIAGAAASVDTLKRLAEEGEYWDAAEEARGLVGKLGRISSGLAARRMTGSWDVSPGGSPGARAKALRDAEARAFSWLGQAGGISRTIDGLFPKPGQLFSKPEAQAMEGMAGTQDSVARKLRDVRESLKALEGAAPMMPEGISQGLSEAQEGMGASSRNLRSLNPYGARADQEGVLDRLEQARSALEKMASPQNAPYPFASGSGGGGGESGWGRELAREPVEIPKPADFTVPREFRQDIMDAMKEGAVRGFEEATKRYYEDLVK